MFSAVICAGWLCLVGGMDFDCVSVTVWPCRILLESGGRSRHSRCRLLLGFGTFLKFEDPRVRLIGYFR